MGGWEGLGDASGGGGTAMLLPLPTLCAERLQSLTLRTWESSVGSFNYC